MVNGVLIIDKPANHTSHDVVQAIRKLSGERRVGHSGTLDPFATGVLIVGIGHATRLLEYTSLLPKTYRARFTLGSTSDTDDGTGNIQFTSSNEPSRVDVEKSLKSFVGTIQQIPPSYAAIKVKGKKLYELARAGEQISPPPRQVTIHAISLLQYEYPDVEVEVVCGSGTYIRAIGRDLGKILQTGAYTKALQRTAIGSFTIEKAVQITELNPNNISKHILSIDVLIEHLPKVQLKESDCEAFRHGRPVEISQPQPHGIFQVRDPNNAFLGIGIYSAGALTPKKVFSAT